MEWLYSIVTAIINRMFKDFFKKVLHGVSTWGVRDWIAFIILIAVIANPLFMNFKIPDSIIKREWSEKAEAERYTEKVTPIINEQIQYILMSDKDATNVMLLSYHNSNHSSQGFSYKYITHLSEVAKTVNDDLHEEEFKELSYVGYGEEFVKLHRQKYYKADSIEQLEKPFPKLYRKFRNGNSNAVTFFPIEGVEGPVGMIVVFYNEKTTYKNDYYAVNIAPYIQRLATILDYNYVKDKM